jgi:serine/threonine protein phosphatase PrpC
MTSRTVWRSFGASVRGRGHVLTGKPNQDSWGSFQRPWADGVVVSDGLGSKEHSDFGSLSACRAVEDVVRANRRSVRSVPTIDLLTSIQEQWRRRLGPVSPADSGATCLFALRVGDGMVRLGLLGDGCVVALNERGVLHTLEPNKKESFSNMTTALSTRTQPSDWQIVDVPESRCAAVVLCTDGVADDIEDLCGFMTQMVGTFGHFSPITASRAVRDMLMTWPVPKHSDDLTLACLAMKVVEDD